MASSYLRGSQDETLTSLDKNASKHYNWRDKLNELVGNGVQDIDWSTRKFDKNGRVKVTKGDILIGRSQPELQSAYEDWRQTKVRDKYGADYYDAFGEKLDTKFDTDPEVIDSKIRKETARSKGVDPYLMKLAGMAGGDEAIASLGDRPTLSQVQQAMSGLVGQKADDDHAEVLRQEGVVNTRAEKERTERARIRSADRLENSEMRLFEAQMRNADRALEREMEMFKIDRDSGSRKAELFKALFGLGSAFMI